MFKLKKVFLMVLVLALVWAVGIAPVFAQGRYGTKTSRPIESTGILTDADGNTMDYAVWIYGLTIYADAASSFIGVYDCDTFDELISVTEYARDEIGEPTQFEATSVWYAKPEYYSDGVGAIISIGVGFVKYGPEPTS